MAPPCLSLVGASTLPATFFRETPAEGKSHIFRDNKGDFDVPESFISWNLCRYNQNIRKKLKSTEIFMSVSMSLNMSMKTCNG